MICLPLLLAAGRYVIEAPCASNQLESLSRVSLSCFATQFSKSHAVEQTLVKSSTTLAGEVGRASYRRKAIARGRCKVMPGLSRFARQLPTAGLVRPRQKISARSNPLIFSFKKNPRNKIPMCQTAISLIVPSLLSGKIQTGPPPSQQPASVDQIRASADYAPLIRMS